MIRRRRKITACLGIALLLFAQFVVAGYACPIEMPDLDLQPAAESRVAAIPCHPTDEQNPNLCKQHCEQSAQSVDTREHARGEQPILPAHLLVAQSALHLLTRCSGLKALQPQLAKPPLYIQHCRFLI